MKIGAITQFSPTWKALIVLKSFRPISIRFQEEGSVGITPSLGRVSEDPCRCKYDRACLLSETFHAVWKNPMRSWAEDKNCRFSLNERALIARVTSQKAAESVATEEGVFSALFCTCSFQWRSREQQSACHATTRTPHRFYYTKDVITISRLSLTPSDRPIQFLQWSHK